MKKTFKKFSLQIVIIAFLFLYAAPAYAIPVIDGPHTAQAIIKVVYATLDFVTQKLDEIKEHILDPLAWVAAKLEVNTEANKVISQIKRGRAEGGNLALFVTDWETFALPAKRNASRGFLRELDSTEKIDPAFKDMLRFSLSHDTEASFFDRYRSTFQEDTGHTQQEFSQDFNKGGWTAWNSILQTPGNNPYLSYLGAAEEKRRREESAVAAREKEALASGGSLGTQNCEPEEGSESEFVGPPAPNEEENPDFVGPPEPPSEEGIIESIGTTFNTVKCKITRPGSTVTSDFAKVLGGPTDSLQNADEISEILSAALASIVGRIRSSGVEEHDTDESFEEIMQESRNSALKTALDVAKQADKALEDLEKLWKVKARSLEELSEIAPGLLWQLVLLRDNLHCQEDNHLHQYGTVEVDIEEVLRHKEKLEKEVGIPPTLGGPEFGDIEPGGKIARKLSQDQQELQNLIDILEAAGTNEEQARDARRKVEGAVAKIQRTLLEVGNLDAAYAEQRQIITERSTARSNYRQCSRHKSHQ